MSYERLLRAKMIEPVQFTDEEVADHLRAARKDIDVAKAVLNTDLDWAFNIAYNGILQTALAFMNHKGYRPKGEAKHYNTFEFMKESLEDEWRTKINRIQKLRQKRNIAVYEQRGIVSEKEALDTIELAYHFHEEIQAIMPSGITKLLRAED